MRRTVSLTILAAFAIAACSSSDDDSADTAPATDEAPAATAGDDADADAGAGASEESDGGGDASEESAAPADDYPDKPDVEIPDEIPTELDVNELEPGTGDPAEVGDIVLVDYVGVRTEDGVEFDASYDRQQPLAVTLGSGGVIDGWDQGLVGAQAGQRLQIDIPSELAYGSEPRGEVIRADDALTFVIDVRSVIPGALEPPSEAGVEASEGATEVSTVDLVEGDGETLEEGDTAIAHFVLFRGDSLVALDSTWDIDPVEIPLEAGTFPGLLEGMPGMQVGGRRAIVIPPESGFGPDGEPQMGLPADTDIVIVVDLLAKY